MTDLDKRIVDIIAQRRLAPRPRAFFRARHLMFWSFAVVFAVFGSISAAVLIYALTGHPIVGWELVGGIPFDDSLEHVLLVWGATVTLFVAGAVVSLRRTRHGHRFQMLPLAATVILASLVSGSLLNALDAGWHVHEIVEAQLPAYQRFTEAPDNEWERVPL